VDSSTGRRARLGLAAVVAVAAGLLGVGGGVAGAVDGTLELVSQPTGVADPDTDDALFGDASADGSRVFFTTDERLTADDTDTGREDVYERAGGVTTLVSQPTGVADPDTDSAFFHDASADGSRVFFTTRQKLTADDTDSDLRDVYERAGGVTTLVSQPTGVADPDTDNAFFAGASADGTRVFFSTVQKLSADDTDSGFFFDVYERAGGVTTLVSRPTGVPDPDTDHAFFEGASDGGNRVFFRTTEKLIADDTDRGFADVYAAGSPDPPPPTPSGPPGSSGAPPAGLPSPLPGLLPGACANQKLGGAGADLLDGTSAGDTLRGLAGNDRLNGLAERDCLFGDTGNDRLSGGADNDRLTGSAGQDRGFGGPGNDRFAGGAQTDTAAGGAGNDRLAGGRGRDRLLGGGGRDRINPGGGRDRIATGPGNDRVSARRNGADTIDCGRGRRDLAIVDRLDSTRNCERVRLR
jgi:hypothetical protein